MQVQEKCEAGMDRTLKKGMNSWYKETRVYRSKEVRMKFEKRMNWSWSQEKMKKVKTAGNCK